MSDRIPPDHAPEDPDAAASRPADADQPAERPSGPDLSEFMREEPVAEVEEPVAETVEPVAETEEPVAQTEEPSGPDMSEFMRLESAEDSEAPAGPSLADFMDVPPAANGRAENGERATGPDLSEFMREETGSEPDVEWELETAAEAEAEDDPHPEPAPAPELEAEWEPEVEPAAEAAGDPEVAEHPEAAAWPAAAEPVDESAAWPSPEPSEQLEDPFASDHKPPADAPRAEPAPALAPLAMSDEPASHRRRGLSLPRVSRPQLSMPEVSLPANPRLLIVLAVAVVLAAGWFVTHRSSGTDVSASAPVPAPAHPSPAAKSKPKSKATAPAKAAPAPAKANAKPAAKPVPAPAAGWTRVAVAAGGFTVDMPPAYRQSVTGPLVTFAGPTRARAYAVNGSRTDATSPRAAARRLAAGYRRQYDLLELSTRVVSAEEVHVVARGNRHGTRVRQRILAAVLRPAHQHRGLVVVQSFSNDRARNQDKAGRAEFSKVRRTVRVAG